MTSQMRGEKAFRNNDLPRHRQEQKLFKTQEILLDMITNDKYGVVKSKKICQQTKKAIT